MLTHSHSRYHCAEVKVVTVREERLARGNSVDTPKQISSLWRSLVATAPWYSGDKEQIVCFCLDTKYRLKNFSLVSIGSLNECVAHPREIFRPAVVAAAHSIIVAHNHPSGDPWPSLADRDLTVRLFGVGKILQIPLVDHIILGHRKYFSFRESASWPPAAWQENPEQGCNQPLESGTVLDRMNPTRVVRIDLSKKQQTAIKGAPTLVGLATVLSQASPAQLRELRGATPIAFKFARKAKTLIAIRNLRSTETDDWRRLRFQRALVRKILRARRIPDAH